MENLYLENDHLNSVLEEYFNEADEDTLLESCMIDLIIEGKLSKEETEAKKAEKMEQKIEKAKDKMISAVEGKIRSKSKKYDSFKLEVKNTTKKEIAKLAGKYAAIGAAAGLAGSAMGIGAAAADYGTKAVAAVAGDAAKATVGATAFGAVVEGILPVLAHLIGKKRFNEIYSVRLYGLKDNKSEEIGYWIGLKISKSDLASDYRSKVK